MNVTALLAHPDDELMCAGTLRKFANRGDVVTVATLFVDDDRLYEWEACCRSLEVAGLCPVLNEDDFAWTRYTVRYLEPQLPETDLWITHRADDANTSHGHIGRIARTLARKNQSSVWECDQSLPGGIVPGAPNLFVDITEHEGRKWDAVDCYGSQLDRYPRMADALLHRDHMYGWQIGTTAAEAFTVHKAVWL